MVKNRTRGLKTRYDPQILHAHMFFLRSLGCGRNVEVLAHCLSLKCLVHVLRWFQLTHPGYGKENKDKRIQVDHQEELRINNHIILFLMNAMNFLCPNNIQVMQYPSPFPIQKCQCETPPMQFFIPPPSRLLSNHLNVQLLRAQAITLRQTY